MLAEKYRPKTFDEIVGQEHIIPNLKEIANRGIENAPHMLFSGPAGTGKTTTAMVLARMWFGDEWRAHFHEFNASDERGIDVVRNKIKRYALMGGWKIIFLDEADNMTSDAQGALRRVMENARQTRFILSCNWEWKIIDPIKSRTAIFRFKKISEKAILGRLLYIVKKEKIKVGDFDEFKKAMILLVKQSDGDLRKAINTLDSIITQGNEINSATVKLFMEEDTILEALRTAVSGDYNTARKMIEDEMANTNGDWRKVIDKIAKAIKKLEVDDTVKARLYVRLADTEANITLGASPIIQILGFISYAWIARYLARE